MTDKEISEIDCQTEEIDQQVAELETRALLLGRRRTDLLAQKLGLYLAPVIAAQTDIKAHINATEAELACATECLKAKIHEFEKITNNLNAKLKDQRAGLKCLEKQECEIKGRCFCRDCDHFVADK